MERNDAMNIIIKNKKQIVLGYDDKKEIKAIAMDFYPGTTSEDENMVVEILDKKYKFIELAICQNIGLVKEVFSKVKRQLKIVDLQQDIMDLKLKVSTLEQEIIDLTCK